MPADPARYDIKLIRGTTWRRSFRWMTGEDGTPVDLTSYSATATVNPRGSATNLAGVVEFHLPQATPENTGWFDVVFDNSLTSVMEFEEAEWYVTFNDASSEPARKIEGLARVRD